jgi:hypothetical protein
MPLYDTRCAICLEHETRKLSFQQYDEVTSGAVTLNCHCGGQRALVFEPSVSFVLKDGESGGWVSKATKENRYRAQRRQLMGRRERDHAAPKKLVPNHNGQVVSSWAEARDAAYQATYQRVAGEHGAQTAADAASKTASTYDTHVKRDNP